MRTRPNLDIKGALAHLPGRTVGQGEPGGAGGPVLAKPGAEAAHLADGAGLGLRGPGREVAAASAAEHVGELADQDAGRVVSSHRAVICCSVS